MKLHLDVVGRLFRLCRADVHTRRNTVAGFTLLCRRSRAMKDRAAALGPVHSSAISFRRHRSPVQRTCDDSQGVRRSR